MTLIALKRLAVINPDTLTELPTDWDNLEYADLAAGNAETGELRFRELSRDEAPTRARRLVTKGDVLISSLVDLRKPQAVYTAPESADSSSPRVFSTGFFSVRSRSNALEPRFLYYLLLSRHLQVQVQAAAMGVTMVAFTPEDLGSVKIRLPDVSLQRVVADSLDAETSQLDELIKSKRRIIELLRERVWAVFAEYVRGCVTRQVPLRRALTSITDGPFGSAFKSGDYSESGAAVVRLGNIGFAEYRHNEQAFIPLELYASFLQHRVRADDLLVAGLGDANNHAGRACVAPDLGPAIVKGKCFCARVNHDVASVEYLALLLSSRIGADAVGAASRGSTRSMINLDIAKSTVIPLPALSAQHAIVRKAGSLQRHARGAIKAVERQIDLLHEHRQALITAGVTGDVDQVRAPA